MALECTAVMAAVFVSRSGKRIWKSGLFIGDPLGADGPRAAKFVMDIGSGEVLFLS